ncbi:MAG: hypothetical protein V4858_10735 [Pseudomonadota bacterium]
MLNLNIPNRPFATEPITGLMLPDGIFECALGVQSINVHLKNTGAAAVVGAQVYVESVDDPGISITAFTHNVPTAQSGVSHVFSWTANFTLATPGVHRISFVIEAGAQTRRVIKKIFVTKIGFDAATGAFTADTPEGRIAVTFHSLVRPKHRGCGCDCKDRPTPPSPPQDCDCKEVPRGAQGRSVLDYLKAGFQGHDPDFVFCAPDYLPLSYSVRITETPPFPGQYGDLPFQDPWWKILLCILAALLLLAAAIAEAVDGTGEINTSGGPGGEGSPQGDCCGLAPSGGGTSYVAAGLLAAAGAAATAAALSDVRDPIRKGQDHTMPAPGALTLGEELYVEFIYGEAVALGKPFTVGAKWEYRRLTTAGTLSYAATEANANVHTLSQYQIDAPDVVRTYKQEIWVVKGIFTDADGKTLSGSQLFVQCFLCGPAGQFRKIVMEDNGVRPDDKALDGIYTGQTYFTTRDRGLWTYFVIAQDVNDANPDLTPEQAAQIIGGIVRTHQLTISFDDGICALVPDGHVNVI